MYLDKTQDAGWFDKFAASISLRMSDAQKQAITLILSECDNNGVEDPRQVAYILATCYHECRFRSIPEIRAKTGTKIWYMQEKYWHTGYYGRGFCQLTHERNYQKFSELLGVDLVDNPDEALRPEIGAKILVIGMVQGLFSGKRLAQYFQPNETPRWLNARRTVNGLFHASLVAEAAKKILHLMQK